VEHLVEALYAARTVTELNRARLELHRIGTPQEISSALARDGDLPQHAADWLARLGDYCFSDRRTPAAFRRTTDDEDWTLYEGEGPPERSELIVGITGAVGKLFQPPAVVLQQLDEREHHLLIVRDSDRYVYGRSGRSVESMERLSDDLRSVASGYRSVVTLGSSMGGAPALILGVRIGARRAVSMGGQAMDAAEIRRYLPDHHAASTTEILCVHGAGHAGDRAAAELMHRHLPGSSVVALKGIIHHNISHDAFGMGTLRAFYEMMLSGEAPVSPRSAIKLPRTSVPPVWARRERVARTRLRRRTLLRQRLVLPLSRIRARLAIRTRLARLRPTGG